MNAYLAFETKSSWSVSGLHSGIRIKIPVKWGENRFLLCLFCVTIYHIMPFHRNRNLQVQCQATFRRRFYDDLCKQDFWPERRFVPAWRSYRDSRYAFTHVFFRTWFARVEYLASIALLFVWQCIYTIFSEWRYWFEDQEREKNHWFRICLALARSDSKLANPNDNVGIAKVAANGAPATGRRKARRANAGILARSSRIRWKPEHAASGQVAWPIFCKSQTNANTRGWYFAAWYLLHSNCLTCSYACQDLLKYSSQFCDICMEERWVQKKYKQNDRGEFLCQRCLKSINALKIPKFSAENNMVRHIIVPI